MTLVSCPLAVYVGLNYRGLFIYSYTPSHVTNCPRRCYISRGHSQPVNPRFNAISTININRSISSHYQADDVIYISTNQILGIIIMTPMKRGPSHWMDKTFRYEIDNINDLCYIEVLTIMEAMSIT